MRVIELGEGDRVGRGGGGGGGGVVVVEGLGGGEGAMVWLL